MQLTLIFIFFWHYKGLPRLYLEDLLYLYLPVSHQQQLVKSFIIDFYEKS
jgi:hypothetical protein